MGTESERRPRLPTAPLAPLAVAVSAGVVADRYWGAWSSSTWVAIALAVAAVAVITARWQWPSVAALLVVWVALGGAWHHVRWSNLAADDLARSVSETTRLVWVRGVLLEVPGFRPGPRPGDAGSTRTVLEVTALNDGQRWQDAAGRAVVVISGDRTDLRAGDAVAAAGSLSSVPGPLNPGEFDYRDYLRAQGIRLRLVVGDAQSIWPEPEVPPPASTMAAYSRALTRWVGAARAWSYAHLVADLDPRVAPVAAALLLGRREGVDPDVNDAFARTGTTHLLAISGLHLQVLAGVLWMVFRLLGLERRRSFLAVSLATIGYALLVGLARSVVRSAAMTVMICVAAMRDRLTRPANTLALAALVTLLLNPAHLFDVGCQLSFLAVAAIAWGVAPVVGWFDRPKSRLDEVERLYKPRWWKLTRQSAAHALQGVAVSLVVWLVTLPLVALRFHLVSPIGILLNIPLIPLTSLALLAAGLTLGASAIWAPLGVFPAWSCAWLLDVTERIVRWGSAQPWGHIFDPGPPWWCVVGFYALLVLAAVAGKARWSGRRWAWGGLVAGVCLGLVLALQPNRPTALEADVLAVGHGLAVVIQTPNGRVVVYDCGRMTDPGVGRRVIATALWSRGVRRIDAVVLSHADADHYNGLPDLLDRFSIGAVRVDSKFASAKNPGAVRLLERVRARGVEVQPIAAGDRWAAEGVSFTILHPPEDWRPEASDNDHSVVLDLQSAGRHLLLTGDLEQAGLTELVARPARRFDAVVVPHHGGRTSNPAWFYQWADPAQLVVSQRRPSAAARDPLAFLADHEVPLLRTWQCGAICLRWSAEGLVARGFLDAPRMSAKRTPVLALAGFLPGWPRGVIAVLGFVLGLALCVAVAVIEWGAWILVRPSRRLVAGRPEPEPWESLELRASDDILLRGAWYPAAAAEGKTAVVLHGFAEDRSAVRSRAEALAHRSWNVAVLDARGHGQSEGDHASFGAREADDLRAWVDFLAARVRPNMALAAWGRSMGAAIALRAAAEDARIVALVLEAPYPDLESAVRGGLRRWRIPSRLAALIVRRAAALAGVSLSRPRPIDLAARVRVPTLILHGSDDPIVPPAEARRLAEAFSAPARVVEVPGARHADVLEVGGHELINQIAMFLAEAVEKRRGGSR